MLKLVFASLLLGLTMNHSFAETAKSKTEEVTGDAKRGVKSTVREVKDKTCEMVNGKMECAAQKVKHSIQNTSDKVEDAVD